jgi:DHA1 family bicyclomycin/chloramphenicol resistance-like MFS transporter
MLAGAVAYITTSVLCAFSPSVESLVAARFVQGLAGAVGIVIAQAAGRDLYSGGKLVRYYGRLTVIGGLAAIVGPVLGGQLAASTPSPYTPRPRRRSTPSPPGGPSTR